MDNNVPVIAKRVWNLVRVAYFLIRKGISKSKVNMLDLNLMMKRGKIAGKAITNLMFQHHYHHHAASSTTPQLPFSVAPDDYEFSCNNSPAFPSLPFAKRRRNQNHHNSFFPCTHAPQTLDDDVLDIAALSPGFARVRQLRITDSPFPLQDANADPLVDKAADEFITRFYKELSLQKTADDN